MENYVINYEVIHRGKYNCHLIDIKFVQNGLVFFEYETLYHRFYEMFAQTYNSTSYFYCQLSENCEIEIDEIDGEKIVNFILINDVTDGTKYKNKMFFYVKFNYAFQRFLDELKNNHSQVIKHSKW